MATFLTGKELEDSIYDLIFKAQKRLLIISPFIKLDGYFKEKVFNKHINNAELHLTIAFGKNSASPEKSFSMVDFEYFKQFPNISVVYVPNLHAKYYANESIGVVTSINLYDYSFKNNIEFGVLSSTSVLGVGLDKIDMHAWEESIKILKNGSAIFIRRPSFKKKLIGKDFMGSETKLDYTADLLSNKVFPKVNMFKFAEFDFVNPSQMKERVSREIHEKNEKTLASPQNFPAGAKEIAINNRTVSISHLSKSLGIPSSRIAKFMLIKGFVNANSEITPLGKHKGLVIKKYLDKDYIAYPANLPELNEIDYMQ